MVILMLRDLRDFILHYLILNIFDDYPPNALLIFTPCASAYSWKYI